MIKKLIAIVILGALLFLLLPYTYREEPNPTPTQTIEATNFVEEGELTFESTGAQDEMLLNYKSSATAPTTTVEILIDESTICSTESGAVPCMAMSTLFSTVFSGKRVVVEGVEKEGRLTPKVIRVLNEFGPLYPGTGIAYVPWAQAVRHIEECNVSFLMQAHNLNVNLELKDGTLVTAVEPVIDEVFRVYDKAKSKCGDIPIATE